MKKAILYFVMMWAVAVSYGQNDSSKSAWIFEMSEGFSKAMGYPSISLFDDATESYNSMSSNISAVQRALQPEFSDAFRKEGGSCW